MLIKDLIYSIIKRWRIFLILTLVMGLFGAGVYTVGYLTSDQSGETELTQATELSSKWQEAEDYYVASLNYIVIGGEEHLGKAPRDAYILHLSSVTFKTQLAQQISLQYDSMNYISSIFRVGAGSTDTGLCIQLIHYDEAICKQFAQYMEEYVRSYGESVTAAVGDHRVILVDTAVAKEFDASSEQWLEQVYAALNEDEKSVQEFVGFSKKKFVIFGFLFAVVSDFLFAVWFLVIDTAKDRVYSFRQLSDEREELLLGDLSFVNLKGKIDRFLYRAFIKRHYFSLQGQLKLIIRRLERGETYVFTGLKEEELDRVKELFLQASSEGISFDTRPLLSEDALELSAWSDHEKVIFVVKRFEDSSRSVRQWLDTYSEINVPVAGILFI